MWLFGEFTAARTKTTFTKTGENTRRDLFSFSFTPRCPLYSRFRVFLQCCIATQRTLVDYDSGTQRTVFTNFGTSLVFSCPTELFLSASVQFWLRAILNRCPWLPAILDSTHPVLEVKWLGEFFCPLLRNQPSCAGSGVERIDPLRFVAGYRKRRLNQALSVLTLSLVWLLCC